ncbi:MAG: hypothetical protein QXS85_05125 [Acidilobaceae archaeon]
MKRQVVDVTEGSALAAVASSLVYAIEDSLLEAEIDSSAIHVYPPPWEALASGESSFSFEVYGVRELEQREARVEGLELTVSVRRARGSPPPGSAPLREVYLSVARLVPRLDAGLLKSLSRETWETGVEHLVLYALDGRVYVLEGEKGSALILPVRAASVIHTHPGGACGLSSRDVRIAARLLDSYVIASSAVSENCLYYLVRLGPISLDDYTLLLNYSSDLLEELSLRTVRGGRLYL